MRSGYEIKLAVNLPFLLCFTLYLRAIFQEQTPGGLYLEGRFNRGFFCVTGLGGLYLKGLIDGGAYFRNFTVFLSLFRLWCKDYQCMNFLSTGTKKKWPL